MGSNKYEVITSKRPKVSVKQRPNMLNDAYSVLRTFCHSISIAYVKSSTGVRRILSVPGYCTTCSHRDLSNLFRYEAKLGQSAH